MPERSRSLRLRALLVTTGALVLVPAVAAAAEAPAAEHQAEAADAGLGPEVREAPPARPPVGTDAESAEPAAPAPIGVIEGVKLLDVTTETLAIGFHEGATRSLAMNPIFEVPAGTPEPVVMGSRGRGTGATTAVDIAVPADAAITAPVSGEIVEANAYGLYGSTEDFLVTIAPDAAPDLRVRMFHLEGPKVTIGDTVVAGETVIADRSRILPFSSQIDRITGSRAPHVHVQVDRS